jgi:hypothetical protein
MHRCFHTKRQAEAYASVHWAHRFVLRLEDRLALFIVPSEMTTESGMIRHFAPTIDNSATSATGSYEAFLGRLSSESGLDLLLAALYRAADPPFLMSGTGLNRDLWKQRTGINTKFLRMAGAGTGPRNR